MNDTQVMPKWTEQEQELLGDCFYAIICTAGGKADKANSLIYHVVPALYNEDDSPTELAQAVHEKLCSFGKPRGIVEEPDE